MESERAGAMIGHAVAFKAGQRVTLQWAEQLGKSLLEATQRGVRGASEVLPAPALTELLRETCKAWKSAPTLVEFSPPEGAQVVVVGDTHGQFHDVMHMMDLAGRPSPSTIYVFNGDYVDRGAWGVETLALLSAYSLALPGSFHMLRGNHESSTCTRAYGFRGELEAKYGRKGSKSVFKACEQLFATLPLAALVAGRALVLHGGLFRQPADAVKSKSKKRKRRGPQIAAMELGSLSDLRRAGKGGQDPSGLGATQVSTDVMWSDPTKESGLRFNDERGIGLLYGPDQTQAFMTANGLSLVLRSHEGPDARSHEGRAMPAMTPGYSVDHVVPAGRLLTVFSAPDYPQFQPVDDPADRFNNLAAVAVLAGPQWDEPLMMQYGAVLPRPESAPFYNLNLPDSDEEFEHLPDGFESGFESEADAPPQFGIEGSPCNSHKRLKRDGDEEADEEEEKVQQQQQQGGQVVDEKEEEEEQQHPQVEQVVEEEEEEEEEEPRPPPRVGLFAPEEAKLTVRWAPTEAPLESPEEAAPQCLDEAGEKEKAIDASGAGNDAVGDSREEHTLPAAPPSAPPIMLHPPEAVHLSSCAAGGN